MDPYILECPHCHKEWEVHPDDEMCYADDEADEILTTCEECGGKFELTTTTEVFFHAEKADNDSKSVQKRKAAQQGRTR